MTDESDNPAPEAGTEIVDTYTDDTPDLEWDYYDPDDDEPDTVEPVAEEGTDDEEGEPEGQPEDVDPEESAEQSDDDEPEAPQEAAETAVVKLPDGTETTVGELSQGYLRQSDYSRKTAELAESRKAAKAQAEQVEKVTQTLVDHISRFIPDEPDPSLAYSNPQQYATQKAQHDAAVQQFQALLATKDEASQAKTGIDAEERQRLVQEEGQKLFALIPEAANEKTRAAFFDGVGEAAKAIGFSRDEVLNATDHRIYALAHWAKKGMDAEKAKASAKAKVAKTAPTPAKKPGKGARPTNSNREAMKRLQRSGSIYDAVNVDFE
jgi:hypothetical protein